MKKLIMADAFVAAATMANAAVSLNWKGNWIATHNLPTSQDSLAAGTQAYLVDANIYTALLSDIAAGTFDTTSEGIMSKVDSLVNDGDNDFGTYINVAQPDINSLNNSWSSGDMTSLYTVIVDNSNPNDIWYGITTTAKGGEVPADKNSLGASWGDMTIDWDKGTQQLNWYQAAAPIPEPTSGLMLLLGVAGLALKRRRA